MDEINRLIKISKKIQFLAYFLFVFIWGEVVFYFTNYSSPGELFYKEYGVNGISLYLGGILIFVILLSVQSKRISDIADQIKRSKLKKEC
ncbi:hypothetical protein ASE40_19275 [Flavobacterium sp. Root935]|jgi:uncharacterized membrane protein YhaH (DUF805 family)|uniref:hypothetical protein n=1 Tax=unclassified Flavobacterium TaxID=196869 RepID=UPI00070FDB4D|nr:MULTISPECIES: hypothetical protein [unclassified Flavobacterium]KRD58470.1 hypothetical protein ASE40_19275 [Flavobacterium sp. Root935]MDQ1164905.1 uncharacterized membrane protein YhaH (DUF805 family) [Flavobacterium sp. SORGH_AS_0622]